MEHVLDISKERLVDLMIKGFNASYTYLTKGPFGLPLGLANPKSMDLPFMVFADPRHEDYFREVEKQVKLHQSQEWELLTTKCYEKAFPAIKIRLIDGASEEKYTVFVIGHAADYEVNKDGLLAINPDGITLFLAEQDDHGNISQSKRSDTWEGKTGRAIGCGGINPAYLNATLYSAIHNSLEEQRLRLSQRAEEIGQSAKNLSRLVGSS